MRTEPMGPPTRPSVDARPARSHLHRMQKSAKSDVIARSSLRFSPINGILLAAGLSSVTAGYVLLGQGSTVAAPLLLVLGYAVLIPLGIVL
jgi:hypothetical protein